MLRSMGSRVLISEEMYFTEAAGETHRRELAYPLSGGYGL